MFLTLIDARKKLCEHSVDTNRPVFYILWKIEESKACINDFTLFNTLFPFNVEEAKSNIQMESIDIQCDGVLKEKV